MLFLKLAWRNTLRNRRRTALTVAVIAIGVMSLVLTWALFDGGSNQSIKTMTGTFTGHMQVHRAGYTDDPSLDRTFSTAEFDLVQLTEVAGVRAAAPRLQAPVLVSTDAASRGVLLVGIEPARERHVTSLHERLVAGEWFANDTAGRVVIGSTLAKALDVRLGDDVAVLTQGLYGSIGAMRFKVLGIYATGNDMIDGMQAFVSLSDAKSLLSAGDELTTVALKLDHYDQSEAAAAQLARLLPASLEVKGWQQLLPDLAQKVNFHEWVAVIVMVMLFGVVMVGITNTIMMSTLERMREFGVVMAIGTRPAQLFRLVLMEAGLIGLMGFALGMALGGGLVIYFNAVGIDLSGQSGAFQQVPGLSSTLYPHLAPRRMWMLGLVVAVVTVGAALYPAWKTACMRPLAAMRGLAGSSVSSTTRTSGSGRWLLLMFALRNIRRHPMRSLLTGGGVMFAMAAFVFMGCFFSGYYKQIVENSTGFITGDGQVQHREFKTRLESGLALDGGPALLEQMAHLPEIRSVSPRAQAPGLVSSPKGSEPVQLFGVQPDREKGVTFLYRSIQKGRYLAATGDHEVVIGRKLAERLRVAVGEKVVVMAQDVDGNLASEAFVVVGLFDTGSHSYDETMAQVSLPALQRMLGLGDRYTSIAYRVRDLAHVDAARTAVESLVKQPEAKVYSWQELLPEVVQMNGMFKGSLLVIMLVVFLTVAVIIMNTVLMSVLERTREFGTMLALGSPPALIVRLVLLESLIIGAAGSLLGTGLGSLAAWVHSTKGMSMKAHAMTSIPGTTDVVYPQLTWAATLQPGVLMPLMILLVSLYPAVRASRLEPVLAMKTL